MCDWSKPGESQADDYKTIGHMIFARAHHHIKSFKKSTGSQLGCDSIEPFFTSSLALTCVLFTTTVPQQERCGAADISPVHFAGEHLGLFAHLSLSLLILNSRPLDPELLHTPYSGLLCCSIRICAKIK
jgi:hypothetical protein